MSNLKRITTVWTGLEGLPGTTTMYGHENGVSAHDQVAAVMNFWGAIEGSLSSAIHFFVNPIVEIVDSTTGEITGLDDTGAGGSGAGANGGDLLPLTTQALVRWRTGVFSSGRELRGRTFIPGWCETENDDGKPTSGCVSLVQSAADTLVGSMNMAAYSPTHHTWASVNLASMWTEWAVLRSRRD